MYTARSADDGSFVHALDKMIMADTLDAAGATGGKSGTPKHVAHDSGASGVDAAPVSTPMCTSLSPDALMSYCQSRLNSLDTQMSQIMAQQQTNATATSAIDNVATLLDDLPGPSSSSSSSTKPTTTISPAQYDAIENAYGAAEKACPQLKESLKTDLVAFQTMRTSNQGAAHVTLDISNLSQLEQNLKNAAGNLNSSSEMTMINLQSLMSQRQTAIQLTTNLVQSLGDQSSSIAKNIGQ